MTYKQICKALRAHRGKVYACINAAGCQHHIEVNKAALLLQFRGEAEQNGWEFELDIELEPRRDGALYLDTVMEDGRISL